MATILRLGTKAKPRFHAQFKDANGVRRTKLLRGASSMEQARIMLVEIERNVMHGMLGIKQRTPEERSRATITVKELSAQFLGDVKDVAGYSPPSIKNLANYRMEARSIHKVRILPVLGARAAASVTTAEVEKLRDAELARRSPASAVQTLAALSKLYNWARKTGRIDCANPVQGCERPPTTPSLDYFSREEIGRLLSHAEEHAPDVFPMLATAIYCGLRKGELYGLRWVDVHLDAARLDVSRSYRDLPKSGKARHLPLHPELARILRGWRGRCPPNKDGLVFPIEGERGPRMGNEGDHRGISELLEAAECHVPEKPWHALRHSFASHAVMSGTPLYDVQQLLGHASPMMTQRYAHLAPDHLAAAVARLSFAAPTQAGMISMDAARRRQTAGKR